MLYVQTDILTFSAFNDVAAHDVQWGELGIPHLETDSADLWKGSYVRSLPPSPRPIVIKACTYRLT